MPHNGGRSQVNVNFLFNGGEYAFLNAFKIGDPGWRGGSGTDPVTPDMLDANGYPTTLVNTLGFDFATVGGISNQILVSPQSSRPGNWVVTWDGNGTIYCATVGGGSMTTVSGSKTSSSGSGRYVFSTDTNNFGIGVASIGSPRITNIKLFHADDEAAINAGEVFGTKFKERLVEGGYGVIRFLNWLGQGIGGANFANFTNWHTRKSIDYAWYCAYELRPSLYCGVTTNVGNAYTASAPAISSATGAAWDGVLRDKTTIHVLFNASATQSGTCSLNVGGTGDINILGSDSGPLSNATNRYPVGGTEQSVATLVYDANLSAWIKRGGDTASGAAGLSSGVPLELMIRLCEEVGAHISIPVPHMTLTPATDWLPKFLELFKSTAPSWMIPWIEGPNETWNPGFLQTSYASATATAYGWGADGHNWYGKAMSHIGQICSFMFSGDRTKYRVMTGVQTGSGTSRGSASTSDPRLSSAKYVANTGGLQAAQTLSGSWGTINISATAGMAEAYRWATHVTMAQYFSPGLYGTSEETTMASAYAGGDQTALTTYVDSLNPPSAAVTIITGTPGMINWPSHPFTTPGERVHFVHAGTSPTGLSSSSVYYVKTIVDDDNFTVSLSNGGTEANFSTAGSGIVGVAAVNLFSIPAVTAIYRNWKFWAQSFGIQKICGYEGGYSPDFSNSGASEKDIFRAASKNVTETPNNPLGMLGYSQDSYAAFMALNDGTFTAEFPSRFQLGGRKTSNNAWSILEDVFVSPNPPQFEADRLFNARRRRLRLNVST